MTTREYWQWMFVLLGSAVMALVALYGLWWLITLVAGVLMSTFIVAEAQVMSNG